MCGTLFAPYIARNQKSRVQEPEVYMANETELFYLVLLTLLTLIVHAILAMKHRRDDKHSHA
jgi:hypothetical protein